MKHSIACKIAVSLLMVILGLQVFTACEDDPKPGPGVPSPRSTDFPSLVQIYTKMKDLPTSQNVLDYRVIIGKEKNLIFSPKYLFMHIRIPYLTKNYSTI